MTVWDDYEMAFSQTFLRDDNVQDRDPDSEDIKGFASFDKNTSIIQFVRYNNQEYILFRRSPKCYAMKKTVSTESLVNRSR